MPLKKGITVVFFCFLIVAMCSFAIGQIPQDIQQRIDTADVNPDDNQDQDQVQVQVQDQRDTHLTTSSKIDDEGRERIEKASEVLYDLTTASDKRIPRELLEHAEAIAVVPNVIQGALGFGGRWGKGVVSKRLPNGRWTAPAFIEIGGGSFGAQIGGSSTDLVLVFTDRKAIDLLEKGKDMKIGVDAAAVAGPVGRSAEAGVNLNLKSGIYSYSRAKGLFAGVALDGAVLDIDDSRNKKVYGSADAREILNGSVAPNPTVQPFMQTLEKVAPPKKRSTRK